MTKRKPYRARTLAGAEKRVRSGVKRIRRLDAKIRELQSELGRLLHERRLLAKACADGPAFDKPLWAIQAYNLRDRILREECGLDHNGTRIGVLQEDAEATEARA